MGGFGPRGPHTHAMLFYCQYQNLLVEKKFKYGAQLADKNQLAKKDDFDMQLQEPEKERVIITPMDGVIITPKNMDITNEIKSGFPPIGFVQHKVSDIELKMGKETGGKKKEDTHSLKYIIPNEIKSDYSPIGLVCVQEEARESEYSLADKIMKCTNTKAYAKLTTCLMNGDAFYKKYIIQYFIKFWWMVAAFSVYKMDCYTAGYDKTADEVCHMLVKVGYKKVDGDIKKFGGGVGCCPPVWRPD